MTKALAATGMNATSDSPANARANNVGWRIDYVMASAVLRPRLKRAWIESRVTGSDHCPVGLELQ